MKPSYLPFFAALLCAVSIHAQEKSPVKFGKIAPSDFTIKQTYDSGASAVVIADIGNSVFEGNSKGWFSLSYKHFRRTKILNKNGFDAAKEEIELYTDGTAEEKLDDLKAVTYNLENGKVVETKLESSSVFKDKLSKNKTVRKFTFPAVKEGSIIEYSYTIKSDFLFNLQPWAFQSEYPCLWSEYEVDIPEFFQYVTLNQGYMKIETKADSYPSTFRVTIPGGADRDEQVTLNGTVNTNRWVIKNIPGMKQENYTSSLGNYISKVEFQLAAYQFQGGIRHDMMGNWQLLSEKLMQEDRFGSGLSKNNNWLDNDLKNVTAGAGTKLEKAQKIFAYVRDNTTCTAHSARYIESSLKEAYSKHSGNVADINLLLTAMLRHEGINADPVLLSTKANGFTNEIYPLIDRFNYVTCRADIDGVSYNLDASDPYNGFDHLPSYCYNGHARIITKEAAMPVYFEADSLIERKTTTVFISNDEKEGMAGSFKSQLGYYESHNLREKLKGSAKEYLKDIKSGNSFEMKVAEAGIDSLKMPDMPALVHYDFTFKPSTDDNIIYFNPMLAEGYKENPFKSADRQYPVEMAYAFDETYVLNMEIPKGYTAEEIPKSVKVAFNENEGAFEYLVQKSDDNIQFRARVRLNKATFTPEDYSSLRDFFGFIVKKENEQIVLKKK
jgi:hypothetical protein